MKGFDLGQPTSFLDHVYLGNTQRECQIGKDIVDSYRSMFESRISAGATENRQTWKVMQRNAWKDVANKTTEQLNEVATPCKDDNQLGEEEIGSVGELSTVCPQIVLKCLYFGSYW